MTPLERERLTRVEERQLGIVSDVREIKERQERTATIADVNRLEAELKAMAQSVKVVASALDKAHGGWLGIAAVISLAAALSSILTWFVGVLSVRGHV